MGLLQNHCHLCFIYIVSHIVILLASLPISLRHSAGFPGWIVDAIIVTITHIYNLFYWYSNVGSLSSIATIKLEHNVSF